MNRLEAMKHTPIDFITCESPLLDLIRLGHIKGFTVPDRVMAENTAAVLGKLGFCASISERSRGFYVKTSSGADTDLWLPDENILKEAYFIRTPNLGAGCDELGLILLESLFFSMQASYQKPQYLIFAASGVKLTVEDSHVLALLQELESESVEILTCKTSLDFYGLSSSLRVGKTVGMTNIYQIFQKVGKVITL
ncbi:MAG: hypothetical protein PHQ23_11955 [Candidatus Wallbacteria bacterium]|nr:hypothetical protein [Candidatus Wallbacteria bacterium]